MFAFSVDLCSVVFLFEEKLYDLFGALETLVPNSVTTVRPLFTATKLITTG